MSALLLAVGATLFDSTLLTFDQARHQYRYAGQLVPGVTSLLSGLHSFAGVGHEVLEAAKRRGTNAHLACQYFDEDDLREELLSPVTQGYLASWKQFTHDCRPSWVLIERPVYHPVLRYAGTPDRFGSMTVAGEPIALAQVDIKTSIDAHPVWGVQTAAYNRAAAASVLPGADAARRFTVQIRIDGTYRLIEWVEADDWPVFVSLTTLRTWKERNRL